MLVIGFLLVLPGCSNGYFANQRAFSVEDLSPISPYGLVYAQSIGKNWWLGTFNGVPVIIHAFVSDKYVNVTFEYDQGEAGK
jgi:hypothetical protein